MPTDPATAALWLVLIPLVTAVITFLLPSAGRCLVTVALAIALLPLMQLIQYLWVVDGSVIHALGGWAAPLGIAVSVQGDKAFLLALIWLVCVGVGLYSLRYMGEGYKAFWPLWMCLWAGLNGLVIADDLFNLYVTLELIGLAAVALTALTGEAAALKAAVRYLILGLTGSLLYLLGVALTYAAYGAVDMPTVAKVMTATPTGNVAIALMTVGLCLKAAIFPAHVWLPPAHANAKAPVSALLSALVVKGAFLILVRLWCDVYRNAQTSGAQEWLGYLGAAALLWGASQAIIQQRLKMLIAYSTVAQLGYLFLLFPLIPTHANAWPGVLLMLAAHALAKTAFFLAAGNVIWAAGHDRLRDLDIVMPRLPVTAFAIALAGVSLIGLPPSGGFLGKWLLLGVAMESERWWAAILLVMGGLLASVYIFRVLMLVFSGKAPSDAVSFQAPPPIMEWAALGMALAAIALGLASELPLALIERGGRP